MRPSSNPMAEPSPAPRRNLSPHRLKWSNHESQITAVRRVSAFMPTGQGYPTGTCTPPQSCSMHRVPRRYPHQHPTSWPGEPRMIFPSFTASLDAARRPLLLSTEWPCRLLSKTSFRIVLELGLSRRPPKIVVVNRCGRRPDFDDLI